MKAVKIYMQFTGRIALSHKNFVKKIDCRPGNVNLAILSFYFVSSAYYYRTGNHSTGNNFYSRSESES